MRAWFIGSIHLYKLGNPHPIAEADLDVRVPHVSHGHEQRPFVTRVNHAAREDQEFLRPLGPQAKATLHVGRKSQNFPCPDDDYFSWPESYRIREDGSAVRTRDDKTRYFVLPYCPVLIA